MRSAWKCGWVILILTTGLMTAGLAGCAPAETPGGTAAVAASAATSAASSAEAVAEIERRYQKILERSGAYGEGGRLVLTVARDALLRGDRIEIRGFGSFKIKQYEGYVGRNPKTGESVQVKPKKMPFFKAGKGLLDYLNV